MIRMKNPPTNSEDLSFIPRYRSEAAIPPQGAHAYRSYSSRYFGDGIGRGRQPWSEPMAEKVARGEWPLSEDGKIPERYSVRFVDRKGRPLTAPILIDPKADEQPGILDPIKYVRAHRKYLSRESWRKRVTPKGKGQIAVRGPGPMTLARDLRELLLEHNLTLLLIKPSMPTTQKMAIVSRATEEMKTIIEQANDLVEKTNRR